MKNCDIEGFPSDACVRIALVEKGGTDQVEFVPVDVMGGEHRTDAFKATNPRAENGLLNTLGADFHHATPGIGPDLETSQCAEWDNQQKEVAGQTTAYLDDLAASEHLAGSKFSVAEITAFAGLAVADFAKSGIMESLSNLNAWRAKVAARPSTAG